MAERSMRPIRGGRRAAKVALMVGAATLALGLAACGGDDDPGTLFPTQAPPPVMTEAPARDPLATPAAPGAPADAPATGGGGTVQAPIGGFTLPSLTVEAGATVAWSNTDGVPHTATSEDGVFDSGTLNEGDRFEFTFTQSGVFAYFCEVHPTMRAEITVD